MQGLAHFQYPDITRAFKQAPWRVQMQWIASLAAMAIAVIALGGLSLTEASRTATAGRDVQLLQDQKAELQFVIDRKTALIAQAKAVQRLETRAREIGFVPAEVEQMDFILVAGYYGPQVKAPPATPPTAPPRLPNYDETLGAWLAGQLSAMFGMGD